MMDELYGKCYFHYSIESMVADMYLWEIVYSNSYNSKFLALFWLFTARKNSRYKLISLLFNISTCTHSMIVYVSFDIYIMSIV